ncbi:helix-turn-helix transcriptional regulator [Nonomuraea bangladeshensis]|uniref:Helix-turn-helix transcriptional regulator n=1 Tax=Nonomuraea bangladeshensis TaxID=404385 RepID=A0ABV3H1H2_9ACTN
MYEERPPAPDLAARVACHWHQVSESSSTQLVVPDACVDLIWGPGGLFVAGPDTGPMPTEMAAGDVFVGIRFSPGAAADLFGVPLHTLRDQRIHLSDLPPAALLAPLTTLDPTALLTSSTSAHPAALHASVNRPDPAALPASFTTNDPAALSASFATPHPRPALQTESASSATRTAPDLAAKHTALAAATRTLLTHLTTPARSAAAARSTASTRPTDPADHSTDSARLSDSARPADPAARLIDSARLTNPTRLADPAAPFIARALRLGRSVSEVARDLGLSERQLHRRSLTAFGYAPKTLQRIVRFQRALRLARAGVPLATVAAEAGYADQAHLSHEVKRLSGVSLRTLAPPNPHP